MDAATSPSPSRKRRIRIAREPFREVSAARPTLGMRGASLNPHEGGSAGRRSRKRASEPTGRGGASIEASRHVESRPTSLPPASSLDGEADGLVAQSRERIRLRLGDRERLSSLVVGGAFVAVAIPLAVLPSSERSPSFLLIVALVAAYAAASRVLFEVGAGFAIPTQLVLVPMLFAVPTGQVPLLVLLGLRRGRAAVERPPRRAARARDRRAGERLARGRAGGRPARRGRGPGRLVALAASTSRRSRRSSSSTTRAPRFASGSRSASRRARTCASRPGCAASTSRSRRSACSRRPRPALGGYAFLATLPLIGLLELFARQRRRRDRPRARARTGLPRHGVPARRHDRGRRRVHRQPQPAGRRARARRRGRARRRRRHPPRRGVRGAAPRRREDPRAERDHQQARPARRRRVGGHAPAHDRRRGDARPRRRPARPRRRHRPRLARALRRQRLPRRPRRRGDPARPRASSPAATPSTR